MDSLYPWSALGVATLATMLTRLSGPLLARSKNLKKIREDVLTRLFPLVILFCLVFKEMAAAAFHGHFNMACAQIVSVLSVVALHMWRRSMSLSILGGTFIHCVLIHFC